MFFSPDYLAFALDLFFANCRVKHNRRDEVSQNF